MINPREEELRRLTTILSLTRKEIDTTNDIRKKEIYRKKYEELSARRECLLNEMKLME